MEEKLKNYLLENIDTLKDIVQEINSYNGNLDYLEFLNNDEEFFDIYFSSKDEVARAICYGEYNYMDKYVRFNGYGNLESFNDYELEKELVSYIEEIVDNLIEYQDNIYINDEELENILESE